MRHHKKCIFFVILGHVVVFLMYNQECHYCQSDLLVIEFTGHGLAPWSSVYSCQHSFKLLFFRFLQNWLKKPKQNVFWTIMWKSMVSLDQYVNLINLELPKSLSKNMVIYFFFSKSNCHTNVSTLILLRESELC